MPNAIFYLLKGDYTQHFHIILGPVEELRAPAQPYGSPPWPQTGPDCSGALAGGGEVFRV